MQFLYLDNIRGFRRATVPFRSVTFLAGENSTGKSTVLSVLHMLTKSSWFGGLDFDTDEYHLGGFDDIVSQGSSEKKRFTVGLSKTRGDGDESYLSIYFISFENNEGIPAVKRFSYLDGETFVSVRLTERSASYRLLPAESQYGKESEVDEQVVSRLARLHDAPTNKGFTMLDKHGSDSGPEILFAIVLTLNKINGDKDAPKLDPFKHFMISSHPVWIAPIRAKPRRTYDASRAKYSSEGGHAPYMLRKLCRTKKLNGDSDLLKLINECASNGHLFDSIDVKTFGESGYGPFEMQVELNGAKYSIANVGYGVSQILPILAEGLLQPVGSEMFIQQPEVHLHPRAQASLGSFFWKLSEGSDKRFVIETHSDYIIDRFRLEVSRSKKSVDASVLFFSRDDDGNHFHEILIDSRGRYSEDQPSEFRGFFIKEQISQLEI